MSSRMNSGATTASTWPSCPSYSSSSTSSTGSTLQSRKHPSNMYRKLIKAMTYQPYEHCNKSWYSTRTRYIFAACFIDRFFLKNTLLSKKLSLNCHYSTWNRSTLDRTLRIPTPILKKIFKCQFFVVKYYCTFKE